MLFVARLWAQQRDNARRGTPGKRACQQQKTCILSPPTPKLFVDSNFIQDFFYM